MPSKESSSPGSVKSCSPKSDEGSASDPERMSDGGENGPGVEGKSVDRRGECWEDDAEDVMEADEEGVSVQ